MTLQSRILTDPDPQNPLTDCDHVGKLYCWHSRYNLGDEEPNYPPSEFFPRLAGELVALGCDEFDLPAEHVTAIVAKHAIVLPLFIYDHSGITMNTTGFACPWDAGQVGYAVMTRDEIELEFSGEDAWERAREALRSVVNEYGRFLAGEVYGFEIYDDDDDEVIDSCWGFIGHEYAEQEAAAALAAAQLDRQMRDDEVLELQTAENVEGWAFV